MADLYARMMAESVQPHAVRLANRRRRWKEESGREMPLEWWEKNFDDLYEWVQQLFLSAGMSPRRSVRDEDA